MNGSFCFSLVKTHIFSGAEAAEWKKQFLNVISRLIWVGCCINNIESLKVIKQEVVLLIEGIVNEYFVTIYKKVLFESDMNKSKSLSMG